MLNFLSDFPAGINWFNKLVAILYRIKGCDHDGPFCIDLGEPGETVYWYCFRCMTKL